MTRFNNGTGAAATAEAVGSVGTEDATEGSRFVERFELRSSRGQREKRRKRSVTRRDSAMIVRRRRKKRIGEREKGK